MIYNEQNLDGWAIPREAFEWIYNNLPHGSTILELGSGNGTKELVKRYNVYSVEDDEKWVGLEPKSNYIYAPLVNDWYDTKILFNKLPKKYDLLIIDGPIREKRVNFIKHYTKFKTDIPIIIDDTHRERDKGLCEFLSKHLNKKIINIQSTKKMCSVLI